MSNTDIQALLNGTAAIQTKIEILPQVAGESSIILTESNGVVSWDYEDFRFIKDQGFIGQFIAKQVTGTIKNPSDNFSMTDREFKLQMGIKVGNTLTWYSLGNFLVKKVTDDEVKDTTKFEALDYAKKFNKRYEDTITYPCTMLELVQNICNQCGCELGSTNFKHKDWVIDGNYFQNNESCRDVMKNLGKLAYSWVRVDWDNKVYFDFTKKTTVDSYNKITNHEYYSLTTQKEKKIVNRVVIGYSNIDGEQTKVEDTASIKANGLCEITIFDNPLVYSQALREKAIVGASDLLGLEYTPLEMQTVGHPWLKGYELIEATDMEGKVYKTIPFNRTIQYFGHIKSLIKIETETKTNTEYAYESGLKNDFLNAQIQVNKKLGTITSTVDEMNTKVEDITTTTQTSTGGNSLYLKEALESNALEYSIDGKCEQSTSTQGKNYYTGNKLTNGTNHGITYTFDNSILKLNGTSSDSGSIVSDVNTKINIPAGTYAYSMRKKSGSFTQNNKDLAIYLRSATGFITGDGTSSGLTLNSISSSGSVKKIITVSKDTELYIRIFVNGSGLVCDNLELEIQIEPGSSMTDFEQFVPNSPSPDYPSEIKTVKGIRNLFNGELEEGGFDNSTGIKIPHSALVRNINPIYLDSNESYIFSNNGIGIIINVLEYKADGTFIKRTNISANSPFTTNNETKYINFYRGSADTDKIQLEPGSVAHSYVPYGTYEKIKVTGKNWFDKDNTYTAIGEASGYVSSDYIPVKKGDTINKTNSVMFWFYDKSKNQIGFASGSTTTTVSLDNVAYVRCNVLKTDLDTFMLTINQELTDYEPYKEKEVLIDLNKSNLFDKDNANILNTYIGMADNQMIITAHGYNRMTYLRIKPNTTYTVSKLISQQFSLGYCTEEPAVGVVCRGVIDGTKIAYDGITRHSLTITTDNNANYLVICYINTHNEPTADLEKILKSIQVYEGYSPYYEISSIGDTKDTLDIVNGQVVIDKKIDKVVLNGSESWGLTTADQMFWLENIVNSTGNYVVAHSNRFKNVNKYPSNYGEFAIRSSGTSLSFKMNLTTVAEFKTWLDENNTEVYYPLKEPNQIILPNVQIPLFEGVNHISLVDDLETTTSIKYLRKTPISGEYALNQDLNKTNSNLADTNNQLSQTQSDIDNTKTNLNNNYYNKEQVDSINSTTTQNITQIRNTMEQNITSTNASISKIQEEITNGVSKVTTTTGTFDENGLNISKSGQQMSSTLDWDGLEVVRDKGKATETEVLTVRSAGVEAENMTVRNFFIKKPIRIEKCKSITDSTKVGLGFFWIGE